MKNERGMMMETNKKSRKVSICPRWNKFEVLAVSLIIINVMLISGRAMAYERYKNNAGDDGSNCSACHGDFTSPDSTKGTIFPSDSKHEMHRSSVVMDTECNLCHTNGDGRNAYIGSSQGTASNPGLGCSGCHGRDYGGIIGVRGAGLRAHHTINGVTTCTDTCHTSDPIPLGEEVPPPYYGTPDTLANDTCNNAPDYLENWSIGDLLGLDNDGDNRYDECGCSAANIDGINPINYLDFALLAADWGQTGVGLVGDINDDGIVDIWDIALLAEFWLTDCN